MRRVNVAWMLGHDDEWGRMHILAVDGGRAGKRRDGQLLRIQRVKRSRPPRARPGGRYPDDDDALRGRATT
jgi:hypothetical protein